MSLGEIMARLDDEAVAAEMLLSLGDLALIAAIETARVPFDESLGEYVSGAARRFARSASDEDWLQLMTGIVRSAQPAASCLSTMLRWSLAQDSRAGGGEGCACGASAGHPGAVHGSP